MAVRAALKPRCVVTRFLKYKILKHPRPQSDLNIQHLYFSLSLVGGSEKAAFVNPVTL